jgi:hypothetical protein
MHQSTVVFVSLAILMFVVPSNTHSTSVTLCKDDLEFCHHRGRYNHKVSPVNRSLDIVISQGILNAMATTRGRFNHFFPKVRKR